MRLSDGYANDLNGRLDLTKLARSFCLECRCQAMLVVGGIAPAAWPPGGEQIEQVAQDLALSPDQVRQHIHAVHHLDPDGQARVLPFVQRIADIFSHIASERQQLAGRLQRIAEISRL